MKEMSRGILRSLNITERKAFLKYLRDGARGYQNQLMTLRIFAVGSHDQTVQKAAITGLSKCKSSEAMLIIAEELLDTWGVGVIEHTVKTSSRLVKEGGLILLSSTLFYDNRFISSKLGYIKEFLNQYDKKSSIQLRVLSDTGELFRDPKLVNEWIKVITRISNLDVKYGAIFGSQFKGLWGWQGRLLQPCPTPDISRANMYVESRIPGLKGLFDETLNITEMDLAT